MQYTSVLVLLLAPLPLALCGFPSRFDCGYALLKKDHKPNTPPCSNSAYMENLGGMDADDCDKLGGHYFYCDNLNRAYPIHCIDLPTALHIEMYNGECFKDTREPDPALRKPGIVQGKPSEPSSSAATAVHATEWDNKWKMYKYWNGNRWLFWDDISSRYKYLDGANWQWAQ